MTSLPSIALALLSAAPVVRPPTADELRIPAAARQPRAAVAPLDGGAPGFHLVSGSLERVDWETRRITLATPSGAESLPFDRNTSVYLEDREGTLLDLKPGQRVRASLASDGRAYWVEVSRPAGQGAADGGAGGGAAGRSDGGAGDAAGSPDGGASGADGGTPVPPR